MVQTPTVLVDKQDKYLLDNAWHINRKGYVIVTIGSKQFYLHRLIMDTPKGQVTDHINHNKLDNRRNNLRVCSQTLNNANSFKAFGKTSKFKGVNKHKQSGLWRAYISFKNKCRSLGYYQSEIEAAKQYNKAAKQLFGEYARLNYL